MRVTLESRFSAREAKAPARRWRYAKIVKGASGTLAVRATRGSMVELAARVSGDEKS